MAGVLHSDRAANSVCALLLTTALLCCQARADQVEPAAEASDPTSIEISKGSSEMSDEEKAITADPAQGVEHAVVLVEETDRDASEAPTVQLRYHLRAKILSNQARALGDITLPLIKEFGSVDDFWALVITPQGAVRELGQEDLEEQVAIRGHDSKLTFLKVVLPEVTPGCVIDFGYAIETTWMPPAPVPLERQWPVRLLRYRWRPIPAMTAAFFISDQDSIAVEITRGAGAILLTARDLGAVIEEPLGPPASEIASYFFPHYTDSEYRGETFWDSMALGNEQAIENFLGKASKRRKLLKRMGLDRRMSLEAQLQFLYHWIVENIKNTKLLLPEERLKRHQLLSARPINKAMDLLKVRRGTPRQITLLFVGLARELGAEAHIIEAVDRTQRYFKPAIASKSQLTSLLVEIRLPGFAEEKSYYLAPGEAMPFGELPWWTTGVTGFKSTAEGAETVSIPAPEPFQNRLLTKVEIEFIEDNEAYRVRWDRTTTGQSKLLDRRKLRSMAPLERAKRLMEHCANSAELEIDHAGTGALEPVLGSYELHCSGEGFTAGLDERALEFRFPFRGGWMPEVPVFTEGERVHPVVFSFPETVRTEIVVHAPEGFVPMAQPVPGAFSSEFGSYELSVVAGESSFSVSREFVMKALLVKPASYPELVAFLDRVRRADATKLLFTRKAAESMR